MGMAFTKNASHVGCKRSFHKSEHAYCPNCRTPVQLNPVISLHNAPIILENPVDTDFNLQVPEPQVIQLALANSQRPSDKKAFVQLLGAECKIRSRLLSAKRKTIELCFSPTNSQRGKNF